MNAWQSWWNCLWQSIIIFLYNKPNKVQSRYKWNNHCYNNPWLPLIAAGIAPSTSTLLCTWYNKQLENGVASNKTSHTDNCLRLKHLLYNTAPSVSGLTKTVLKPLYKSCTKWIPKAAANSPQTNLHKIVIIGKSAGTKRRKNDPN